MTTQTHESFTREDGEKCQVLVTGTDVPGQSEPVFFIDEPRELLRPDNANQGWFFASNSGLRYQR